MVQLSFDKCQWTSADWVQHQPAQELRIEIRALGRHLLQVRRDRLDVLHPRGGDEAGEVALAMRRRVDDLVDQVDVGASRSIPEGKPSLPEPVQLRNS